MRSVKIQTGDIGPFDIISERELFGAMHYVPGEVKHRIEAIYKASLVRGTDSYFSAYTLTLSPEDINTLRAARFRWEGVEFPEEDGNWIDA